MAVVSLDAPRLSHKDSKGFQDMKIVPGAAFDQNLALHKNSIPTRVTSGIVKEAF